MKVIIKKEIIIEGLQKAASILPSKAGTAYLRSLWIRAKDGLLYVMSTDANMEFIGKYPADIQEEGIIGISGKLFVDLIRQLPPGEIKLSVDNNKNMLLIEVGKRKYKLPIASAEWFQELSTFPEEDSIIWSGDFFQDVLDKVTFCISDNEESEALSCMFLGSKENGYVNICGLNDHQFALMSFIHDDLASRLPQEGILIQKKYLQDIKKWLVQDEIELNFTDKRIFLRTIDNSEMISLPRAIYSYPDYNGFINRLLNGKNKFSINRKEAIDSLSRIQIFNTENYKCLHLKFEKDEVILSTKGQDIGSATESLDTNFVGDLKEIMFPTRNLLEIFSHFVSNNLDITLTSIDGPCGIHGNEDVNYTVIIMPMKMTEQSYYEE